MPVAGPGHCPLHAGPVGPAVQPVGANSCAGSAMIHQCRVLHFEEMLCVSLTSARHVP
jgi:hypothetical protein